MGNEDYCIRAGEFQQLCQTTRDCLRHYAETGILVPYTDPENGYHYYSYAQVGSFYMIKVLRDMDTPIANISGFLNNAENMGGEDFISRQYNILLQKRNEIDMKIKSTGNMLWFLELSKKMNEDTPVVIEIKGKITSRTTKIKNPKAYSIKDVTEDVKRHMGQFNAHESAFPLGVAIKKEDFFAGEYRYDRLFSPMMPEKPQKNEYTRIAGIAITSSPMYNTDIKSRYKVLADFLGQNNLTAQSDIFSLSLVNVIDPEGGRRYLKCAAVIV